MNTFATHTLLIRPSAFRRDPEAALTNAFMECESESADAIRMAAQQEFDGLVAALGQAGVVPHVVEDRIGLPDSVFPNNWFSWHQHAHDLSHVTLITYPMCVPSRRQERELVDFPSIAADRGLQIDTHVHFETRELSDRYLEGTGSLVLDPTTQTVYAATSPRTDAGLVREWAELMKYTPVVFDALDPNDMPIYHTNVMLTVGHGFVLFASRTVPNPDERRAIMQSFEASEKDVVELTWEQVTEFAGNALQLRSTRGHHVLAMSDRARAALAGDQLQRIEKHTEIVSVPIPTIERIGGGSVRCMIAELGC